MDAVGWGWELVQAGESVLRGDKTAFWGLTDWLSGHGQVLSLPPAIVYLSV